LIRWLSQRHSTVGNQGAAIQTAFAGDRQKCNSYERRQPKIKRTVGREIASEAIESPIQSRAFSVTPSPSGNQDIARAYTHAETTARRELHVERLNAIAISRQLEDGRFASLHADSSASLALAENSSMFNYREHSELARKNVRCQDSGLEDPLFFAESWL